MQLSFGDAEGPRRPKQTRCEIRARRCTQSRMRASASRLWVLLREEDLVEICCESKDNIQERRI